MTVYSTALRVWMPLVEELNALQVSILPGLQLRFLEIDWFLVFNLCSFIFLITIIKPFYDRNYFQY